MAQRCRRRLRLFHAAAGILRRALSVPRLHHPDLASQRLARAQRHGLPRRRRQLAFPLNAAMVVSPKIKPPKYATIKSIALGFPDAHEVVWRGWPWFNVGKKTFALYSDKDKSWIFKLPHHQQMMLFDARPETFRPMIAGRLIWSFVR